MQKADLNEIKSLLLLFVPKEMELRTLSNNIGVMPLTLLAHVKANFKKDEEWFQTEKGGKITLPLNTAIKIQQYYTLKKGEKSA
jgi:hypothetical protein